MYDAYGSAYDDKINVRRNVIVRLDCYCGEDWIIKGCLHYDTCTPYMYVVQVYGVHVS